MRQAKNDRGATVAFMEMLAADAKRRPPGDASALAEIVAALPPISGFDAEATLNELRAGEFLEAFMSDAERMVKMSQEMQRNHESKLRRQMRVLHQRAEADPNIGRALSAFEELVKRRRAKRGRVLSVVV